MEVGKNRLGKQSTLMVFFFQLLKAAYWSFPCWCVSDLIIFQDQALKESLHEHGVKVSFFWIGNNWISSFSMLPNSGFHQTQAQSLICLVHSSLTLWFHVVEAWPMWQKLLKILTHIYKLVLLMLVFVQVLMLISIFY